MHRKYRRSLFIPSIIQRACGECLKNTDKLFHWWECHLHSWKAERLPASSCVSAEQELSCDTLSSRRWRSCALPTDEMLPEFRPA